MGLLRIKLLVPVGAIKDVNNYLGGFKYASGDPIESVALREYAVTAGQQVTTMEVSLDVKEGWPAKHAAQFFTRLGEWNVLIVKLRTMDETTTPPELTAN